MLDTLIIDDTYHDDSFHVTIATGILQVSVPLLMAS